MLLLSDLVYFTSISYGCSCIVVTLWISTQSFHSQEAPWRRELWQLKRPPLLSTAHPIQQQNQHHAQLHDQYRWSIVSILKPTPQAQPNSNIMCRNGGPTSYLLITCFWYSIPPWPFFAPESSTKASKAGTPWHTIFGRRHVERHPQLHLREICRADEKEAKIKAYCWWRHVAKLCHWIIRRRTCNQLDLDEGFYDEDVDLKEPHPIMTVRWTTWITMNLLISITSIRRVSVSGVFEPVW